MNFNKNSRSKIKNKIIKHNLIPYQCDDCSITEWQGQKLSLHLDHKNGINDDNRLENLRFLCPNCHSLTETYCGKNNSIKYGTANLKVQDDVLVESMRVSLNPTQALSNVKLAGAGNYKRVYRLAELHDIEHMKEGYKAKLIAEGNYSFTRKFKFSDQELIDKLDEFNQNQSAVGRFFGCSSTAIRRRLQKIK